MFRFIQKKIKLRVKIKKIPKDIINSIDFDRYYSSQNDLKMSRNKSKEHFILYGYDEIKEGKRQLYKSIPLYDEKVYLNYNEDLKNVKESNEKFNLFHHFLEYGHIEYINMSRVFIGYYPFIFDNTLQKGFKDLFDEEHYLEINQDVKKKIDEGVYESGWEHFKNEGVYELREGKREIHRLLPGISESKYFLGNEDIRQATMTGDITPFVHFLKYGYQELLEGTRVMINNSYLYEEPVITNKIKEEIDSFKSKPLISIIMPVYNVDPKWLKLAIDSVKRQWYKDWELCIVDDKSSNQETVSFLKAIDNPKIKIKFLDENVHISKTSNHALALATGEYVALMDHDDELTSDALYEVVKIINEEEAEFIYSDEDKLELTGQYSDPHFKSDFAPDLFLSQNYLSHLGVIKKSLILKVDGFTKGLEGSQDYDLYLKVLEHTDKIYHIPKVLYHWRKIPGSTAAVFSEKSYAQEAGRRSLENAMKRRGIDATVVNGLTGGTYKVNYVLKVRPLITIVIPFKDRADLLEMSIKSVLEQSTYENYEIIGISNNSELAETFEMMKKLESLDERVLFHEYNKAFNYSAINNYAVKKYAKGEHIVLMNNDIKIITPHWIEELLMLSQRDDVGAVGAKLIYPDDTIQHAGLVLAPLTEHSILSPFNRDQRNAYGYFSRLQCINNYNAVTAALLMVQREYFLEVGGFDEEALPVAYNDVDLCLSLREQGYVNIYTPFVEAYHYESASRGYDTISVEKMERMYKEVWSLKEKHPMFFQRHDQYYSKNLSDCQHDFSLAPIQTTRRSKYIGHPFSETIIKKKKLSSKRDSDVCIFSHFDKDNLVDDYVVYYLEQLAKVADIVFVSTAEALSDRELSKIEHLCRDIIVKENYGYDFGAWKTGMKSLGKMLDQYEWLYLCNDSVYGPLQDLDKVIKKMKGRDINLWSMSDNYELDYHLQSFFVAYDKKARLTPTFLQFWEDFKIYEDKSTLVKECEVVYSKAMIQEKKLSYDVFFSAKNISYMNILHYKWDYCIQNKLPFIKVELLRSNPRKMEIGNWKDLVGKVSDYSVDMILSHLKRF